jgi:hypothetical protein
MCIVTGPNQDIAIKPIKRYYVQGTGYEQQDEGIKIWEVSRSWSDNIDNLLVKGFLTLEVKRTGAATDTSYLFAPVVSDASPQKLPNFLKQRKTIYIYRFCRSQVIL